MGKKIYAVLHGRKTGIFTTWDETKEQVDGFKGAKYGSFFSEDDAKNYLSGINNNERNKEYELISYVDGSQIKGVSGYGSGVILLDSNQNILKRIGFKGEKKEYLPSKQIPGETSAAIYAISWAVKKGYHNMIINYDYEGIEKWATGLWKTKGTVSKDYKKQFDSLKAKIDIKFNKVKAHSNIKYNDMVDRLAKDALDDNKHVENSDGSHKLKGISDEDLIALIEVINDEGILTITVIDDNNDKADYNVLDHDRNRARITYFKSEMFCLVQGKSDSFVLKQIVTYLASLLTSSDAVIDTLSELNSTKINKTRVESLVNKFVPHYQEEQQVYKNILYQSIVNYDDTAEAYEYTYKITPALRLSEYYLSRIFDNITNGHDATVDLHGRHSFGSVFSYNKQLHMHCLKSEFKLELNDENKIDITEKMYRLYNKRRSVYFHTNDDSRFTDSVNSNSEVQEILNGAFELFDKYYEYFV